MRKFHKRYAFIIDLLSKFINIDGKIIIDCACGDGDGIKMFKRFHCQLIGIDIDKKKICFAKKRIKDIDFRVGSIVNLDLSDNSADVFICSETLEHLTKKQTNKAAQEILRIMKPTGQICVTVPRNRKKCLKNKNHKQYISAEKIRELFNCKILSSEIFFKNEKHKEGGNLIMLLEKDN